MFQSKYLGFALKFYLKLIYFVYPALIRLIYLICLYILYIYCAILFIATVCLSQYIPFYSYMNCQTDKKSSGSSSQQPRRSRKRDLLKRVMSSSSSHHRSNTIDVSDSERNFDEIPVRDVRSIVSAIHIKNVFHYQTNHFFICWMRRVFSDNIASINILKLIFL